MINLTSLKKCPLFAGINSADIESILSCFSSESREYRKDEYILTAGNITTRFAVVLSGSVNIIKEDYWGNRYILAKMETSELFGEAFSCAGGKALTVSAVACENTSILFLECHDLLTVCPKACGFHNVIINNLMKIMADKNLMLTQKISHLTNRSTKDKLLSFLSSQSQAAGSNSFNIAFNRQELADYLSVDRSAMSNELCKLRDEGIINFNKNSFILL